MRDIRWRTDFEEAREEARRLGRPLAVKPAGQGIGHCDDW